METAPEGKRVNANVRRQLRPLMFWGEPFCEYCHHKGPDLMWMWHHGIGLHILLRDKATHELRVIEIPDGPEFYRSEGQSDHDRRSRSTAYVNTVVFGQLVDTEEMIEQSRIAYWEFESNGQTNLQCPHCCSMLKWRGTGIS